MLQSWARVVCVCVATTVVLLSSSVAAPPGRASPAPYETRATAFTHVNVVTMTDETVRADQTVVVRNGRIAAIGEAGRVRIPFGARRIEGRGRYLLPGLADMHMHLPYGDGGRADIPAVLQLYVANGVTTVMNLLGLPEHFEARARVASGEWLGPEIWTSGFFVNQPFVTTPEEVERSIAEQSAAGVDVIKLHGELTREAYARAFEVARREGLPVIGHIPRNLGVAAAIEERQGVVVHAEEYLGGYYLFAGRHCCDDNFDGDTRALARSTAEAGTWVIPTLAVFKGIAPQIEDLDAVLARPDVAYMPASVVEEWLPANNRYRDRSREELPAFAGMFLIQQHLVRRMHEAGVRMMAGSDAPANAAVSHGFAIHDELAEMVAAGLTPYEALRAATYNPAEWLGRLDETGAIERGKRADLVLLDANPLQDIGATRAIRGVMIRGRWMPRREIEATLQTLRRPS